jgi:uncharacterized C2H2 Zn-finger protein
MITPQLSLKCPRCQNVMRFDARKSNWIRHREAELLALENQLREREQHLTVREAEREADVRLVKSCLHPDKHPEQAERYTRAWQAFERLLASGTKPISNPLDDVFNDDIPF